MIHDSSFRLYDIRGIVPIELPIEEIGKLTRAIAYFFKQQNPHVSHVVVGRDGRLHSPDIHALVTTTLTRCGLHVIDIGICPSPVLYFTLATHPNADAGIMITASHNGKEYNGMKLCLGRKTIWGAAIKNIKQLYQNLPQEHQDNVPGIIKFFDAVDAYCNWMHNAFKSLQDSKIACTIDCANASSAVVIPRLIQQLGWKNCTIIFEEIDGSYPNHDADPTQPENMHDLLAELQKNNHEFGVGFDGDADRMVPILSDGQLILGDQLLTLFGLSLANTDHKNIVIYDIKCSSVVPQVLQAAGLTTHMSPSGHALIKEQMLSKGAALAGELSCHFFFADKYFGYDDGIYAFLRLIELLHTNQKSLTTLLTTLPQRFTTPEYRRVCPPTNQHQLIECIQSWANKQTNATTTTIDGVRVDLPYGWVLVRASNTQPVICIRYEGVSDNALKTLQEEIEPLVSQFIPASLPERTV